MHHLRFLTDQFLRSAEGGSGAAGGGASQPGAGEPGAGGAPTAAAAAAAPWYGAIEDADLKAFVVGKNAPDLGTALKSWMHADKLARDRNVLTAPGENTLEWDGWAKLGWEPDAGKYKLAAPGKVDGVELDQAMFDFYGKAAHELRIPAKQAEALYGKVFGYIGEQMRAAETAGAGNLARTEEALRKDWGADYDIKREMAARAMRTLGLGMDDAAELEPILGAPGLVRHYAKIGEMLGEAKLVAADGSGTGLPRTVEGVDAELSRLQSDPQWMKAFQDPRNPNHQNATAQRQRLLNAKAKALGLK